MFFLSFLLACGVGVDGDVSEKDRSEDRVEDVPPPEVPAYSGGDCPTLVDGRNEGFMSAGKSRSFLLELPEDPEGRPLVFGWHWLGGNASQIMSYLGLSALSAAEDVVVVAPESDGSPYEWHSSDFPTNNPDLILFDDIVSCLHQQYDIDLNAIHSTGMSAGGIWTSYLLTYRSEILASAAPLSGGVYSAYYQSPEAPIPVLLTWGGPGDTYGSFSFDQAGKDFSTGLRRDGHFVVECIHSGGHTIPYGAIDYVWRFLDDHPRGVDAAYSEGLPDDFPSWCRIPD